MATEVLINGDAYVAIPTNRGCSTPDRKTMCVFWKDHDCKAAYVVSQMPDQCRNRIFIKPETLTPELELKVVTWRLKS